MNPHSNPKITRLKATFTKHLILTESLTIQAGRAAHNADSTKDQLLKLDPSLAQELDLQELATRSRIECALDDLENPSNRQS